MTYVLDTNIAFEIAFNGKQAEKYKEILKNADTVLAPTLFQSEVTNVLWQYMKAGFIDEENAKVILAVILQLVDDYIDTSENMVESLHEAGRLNHSAYDMFYFTLARRYGATLLTLDKKLRETAVANGVRVG